MHFLDRDQAQAAAQARAQVGALAGTGTRLILALPPQGEGARALDRRLQALGPHRLDQVVDRRGFERRQRVGIVGGAEHHRRARLERGEMARGLQPVDAGHGDVQQHQVGVVLGHRVQRGMAVAHLGHQFHAVLRGQQRAQALARQRLVIGDHHLHFDSPVPPAPSSGRSSSQT